LNENEIYNLFFFLIIILANDDNSSLLFFNVGFWNVIIACDSLFVYDNSCLGFSTIDLINFSKIWFTKIGTSSSTTSIISKTSKMSLTLTGLSKYFFVCDALFKIK